MSQFKLSKQGLTVAILVVLTLSFFMGLVTIPTVKAEEDTLIDRITNMVDNVCNFSYVGGYYATTVQTVLTGLQFGKSNYTFLNDWLNTLTSDTTYGPLLMLLTYSEMRKLGDFAENETLIEWALDHIPIMSNGLPNNYNLSTVPNFLVLLRFTLSGFYYAEKYNYALDDWNVSKAYASFRTAIYGSPNPWACYVFADNTTQCGYSNGRYYDEAAETMDCFLWFYELGEEDALDDAVYVWNAIQPYFWNTAEQHYGYSSTSGYECEAGGFLQVALKLRYYAPDTGNISRVTTDIATRFLSDEWMSPQWTYGSTPYYVVVHHHTSNSERRLQNNVMAWAALFGDYYNFTSEQKTNMTNLLTGFGSTSPAWKLLFENSTTWDGTTFFNPTDPTGYMNSSYNQMATSLLLMFGIVPETGTLAIPLNEQIYEDRYSIADPELYALDLTNRILTFSVIQPGTFKFIYGTTPVTYNFTQQGIYNVTFASDYNSITSAQKIDDLPSNRIYMFNYQSPNLISLSSSSDIAGQQCLLSSLWFSDYGNLDTYMIEENSTGTFSQHSGSFSANPDYANTQITLPGYDYIGDTIAWRVHATNSYGYGTASSWQYFTLESPVFGITIVSTPELNFNFTFKASNYNTPVTIGCDVEENTFSVLNPIVTIGDLTYVFDKWIYVSGFGSVSYSGNNITVIPVSNMTLRMEYSQSSGVETYTATSTSTESSITSTSTSTQTFTQQTTTQTVVIFGETNATYYFRSDSRLTNGQFGYSLETENSILPASFSVTHGGDNVTYAFDIYLAQYGNLTTLLGDKVAEITVSGVTEGYESAMWTAPERQLIVGYDAFMIVINAKVDSGAWQAKALYVSPVLVSSQLLEQTWAFQLYVNRDATYSTVYFGDAGTYDSRIEGVGLREPTENEIQSYRWSHGDIIGMIFGAYTDYIGSAFYVIILLITITPLYMRHRNTGVIWVAFLLMSVGGIIPWAVLPSYAAAFIDAILVLVLAFLVWRVIR